MAKSLLASLSFTNEKKPSAGASSADPVRKFIESMDKQIAYVEMEATGQALPQKTRKIYWKKGLEYFISLTYGNVPLDFGSGSNIKCGKSLEDVKKVMNTLKEVAKAEDETLVEAIHSAASSVSARLSGRGGRKAK